MSSGIDFDKPIILFSYLLTYVLTELPFIIRQLVLGID